MSSYTPLGPLRKRVHGVTGSLEGVVDAEGVANLAPWSDSTGAALLKPDGTLTAPIPSGVTETPGFAVRTQVCNRVGKVSVGNFPINAWDHSIYSPRVVYFAGTYRMYYTAYQSGYTSPWVICMATSTDLITWTKANLGLFTYGGNTNNNIVISADPIPLQMCDAWVDTNSPANLRLLARNDTAGTGLVYTSTDGINFTYVTGTNIDGGSGLANGGVRAHPNTNMEVKALTWNPVAGKYRYWYVDGHAYPSIADSRRSIGYYDSATLAGPWTNRGLIPEFTSTDTTLQYYDISIFYVGARMFAAVNIYNKTTELLSPLRCYESTDNGDTWIRYMDLLQRPESDEWDYGLISDGTPFLKDGVWYLYYGGKTGNHASTVQIFLGLATTQIG